MTAPLLPLVKVDLQRTHRVIPSRFDEPVLDDIAGGDLALLDAMNLLDAATNPRFQQRRFPPGFLLPDNQLLHSHIVNGAFTHGSSESRFSSPAVGAWYASDALATAQVEVDWHKRLEFGFKDPEQIAAYFPQSITFTDWQCSPRTLLHAITDRTSPYLDPVDIRESQLLAENLRADGSLGIRYPSVRDPHGMNVALFQPTVVHPVAKGAHLTATWASPIDTAAWHSVR